MWNPVSSILCETYINIKTKEYHSNIRFFAAGEAGYWILWFLRAVNGAGSIGAISSAFVLTSEIFEPKSRVMALQVAQVQGENSFNSHACGWSP